MNNTLVSTLTAWVDRLNHKQLLLLNFIVSSIGLIKLSMLFASLLDHRITAQLIYLQAGLSDWAIAAGMSKHLSLLQFVLSVVALFAQYAFFNILTKSSSSALTRFFHKEHRLEILLILLATISINSALLFMPSKSGLAILAVLWLVSYLWVPLYCIKDKLSAIAVPNLAWQILLAVIVFQYAAIFVPLITDPMKIENDYLNIPERTILKSGQVVDNLDYINKHQIAGFHLYDPRKDAGHNPPALAGTSLQIENCQSVSQYLQIISGTNKYKYSCDRTTNALIVRPPMTVYEKSYLDKLQLSAEDRARLDSFFITSWQLGQAYKNHAYSEEEKDFIKRNATELTKKIQAGWFFYHHNYYFGPMNALSLGAPPYSQAMVYGWLSTVTVGKLLDRLGMMNYQGYFKVFFSVYLIYFAIFLLGVWAIFKRLNLVVLAAVLSISSLFLLGIEFIRLAPGFNPIRHFFDIPAFYLFYRYLSQGTRKNLVLACVLALFAILWSKDFGLFLSLSIGGAVVIMALTRGPVQRFPLFMGGMTIAAALILYLYPFPGGNPTALYMILGAGSPPTLPALMWGTLLVINILLIAVILVKQKEHYKTLTIGFLFYAVQSTIYLIWYPSLHHLLSVAPIHILLLMALVQGWLTHDQDENRIAKRYALILVPVLAVVYLPAAAYFYSKQHAYYQTFENHQLYNWTFKKASFSSTIDPALFEEAANLIQRYSSNGNGIFIISKYDHILPVLAGKYSAMPYNELPTNLVSSREIAVASGAILKNKPAFLFVDSDIDRGLNAEIPAKGDPATTLLSLGANAKARVMVLQGLNQVYDRVADKYSLCESGRLISVYCRKPD